MTSFTTPATTAPVPASHVQLGALIATVKKLVVRAESLSRTANAVQDQLDDLLDTLDRDEPASDVEEPATIIDAPDLDPIWVRREAKTPQQVEAEHINSPDGTCACWTVYIGREPGVYFTTEGAQAQVRGVPNQQVRRRTGKADALALYRHMSDKNKVEKWVEVFEDVASQ
ncbi:hypothetical protein C8R47DRAFT_1073319 [Mycena vitilis]|nr:hypothetical protein C8R47DRAFT_1225975 [Mycena vitilis]KAJ6483543.1 hypothetical protein C8R47DRAFT_1073319 [Mycena vitilis]